MAGWRGFEQQEAAGRKCQATVLWGVTGQEAVGQLAVLPSQSASHNKTNDNANITTWRTTQYCIVIHRGCSRRPRTGRHERDAQLRSTPLCACGWRRGRAKQSARHDHSPTHTHARAQATVACMRCLLPTACMPRPQPHIPCVLPGSAHVALQQTARQFVCHKAAPAPFNRQHMSATPHYPAPRLHAPSVLHALHHPAPSALHPHAPAFWMKFSSVHVSPDSHRNTGTGRDSAAGGRYMVNVCRHTSRPHHDAFAASAHA